MGLAQVVISSCMDGIRREGGMDTMRERLLNGEQCGASTTAACQLACEEVVEAPPCVAKHVADPTHHRPSGVISVNAREAGN